MSQESEQLQAWLQEEGIEAEFLSYQESVHTVEDAVRISGFPIERFTKSIVMLTTSNDLVIAMVPAASRASTERVRKVLQLEERPRPVDAEESVNLLGQQVGGNSPLNASQAKILIDPKVTERDWILTGGGDNRSLVKISIGELTRVVDYQEVRVRK